MRSFFLSTLISTCMLTITRDSRRTGKGYDFGSERPNPRNAQLPGSTALLRCDGLELFNECEVVLDVVLAEARQVTTGVILGQVIDTLDRPSQETVTKRAGIQKRYNMSKYDPRSARK